MTTTMTILNASLTPDIQARFAEAQDAPRIMELYRITAEWLRSKGSTQWADLIVGIDRHDTPAAIARREVFLFESGGDPAAVVILMPRPSAWDKNLWGTMAEDPRAVYLHRLSVHRDFAGRRLGPQVLAWTETSVAYPPGVDRIRLDCIADNPRLNAVYREAGYAHVGEKDGFNLYEKPIASA